MTKIVKKDENDNEVNINPEMKIKSQIKNKDKIYYDLELSEIWLNIDMDIEEEKIKFDNEMLFSLILEVKNPIEIDIDHLSNLLPNISMDMLSHGFDEIDEENETNIENKNTEIDYYLLYKFEFDIDNGYKKRKKPKNKNESTKTFVEMTNTKFTIDNKITCKLSYINFTNYIFNNINYGNENYNHVMRNFFNNNFSKIYEGIILKYRYKICLFKNLIYIKELEKSEYKGKNNYKYNFDNDETLSDNEEYEYLEKLKNINYDNILRKLHPYPHVFKVDFKRITDYPLRSAENKNIEKKIIKKRSDEENNNIFINDKSLDINIVNNESLIKKGILVLISIILFIIILYKMVYF